MFGLGVGELALVTIIVVFLFGAKKLPALGEAVGKSINSFKKGLKEDPEAKKESIEEPANNNNSSDNSKNS